MTTARLPSHVRLLPQTPWRLAMLTACHRMTAPKEKTTCSSPALALGAAKTEPLLFVDKEPQKML